MESKISISIAPKNDKLNKKVNEMKREVIYVSIDVHLHRMPIQIIHKITLIK